MDSDVPRKISGLFKAFKSSVAKAKQNSTSEADQVTVSRIRVINHTGDIESFDAEEIANSISKAFDAIVGRQRHIKNLIDRISCITRQTQEYINRLINCYFRAELFNAESTLKFTAASDAISIFKKSKEITLSVIFTTTRNFSIQKNLSISA